MGLDITAYGSIELLPEGDYSETDPPFGGDYIRAYVYEGLEASSSGLELGRYYKGDRSEAFKFRAGSYGGYNHWREELAKLAGYQAKEAWADPEGHAAAPFYLLVNFADNEGTIGPEAAAELSADFGALHGLMRYRWADRPAYQLLYRQWTAATCLASDAGLINLH